jgi:hypothetical protein
MNHALAKEQIMTTLSTLSAALGLVLASQVISGCAIEPEAVATDSAAYTAGQDFVRCYAAPAAPTFYNDPLYRFRALGEDPKNFPVPVGALLVRFDTRTGGILGIGEARQTLGYSLVSHGSFDRSLFVNVSRSDIAPPVMKKVGDKIVIAARDPERQRDFQLSFDAKLAQTPEADIERAVAAVPSLSGRYMFTGEVQLDFGAPNVSGAIAIPNGASTAPSLPKAELLRRTMPCGFQRGAIPAFRAAGLRTN